jgi:predicted transcriptional regulator
MYNTYIMEPVYAQSLSRTQIYLTTEQQAALGLLSKNQSRSKSELIRSAIDRFITAQQQAQASTRKQRLAALSGAWTDNSFTGDVREMRAAWGNRPDTSL